MDEKIYTKKKKKIYIKKAHQINIFSFILEANRKAIEEGIKANSVFINDRLVKTNSFVFRFCNNVVAQMPPMICGLEAYITKELPDEYAFAVLEKPQTDRDKIVEQTRKDTVSEFVSKIDEEIQRRTIVNDYAPDFDEMQDIIYQTAKEYGVEDEQ